MGLVKFCVVTLASAVALLLLAQPAHAQATTAQKATAEAYFDDALRLMQRGAFAEACPKLEASQRIDPAVGTLLYLAECYEKQGRTASAWVTFREADALGRAAGQAQRAEKARVHAERLQAGLSRVTVEVAPEARSIAGLQVRCGSVPIDLSLPSAPVPVDPGEVVVEASAPGYSSFSRSVSIVAGARITVSIPVLVRQSGAVAAAAPVGAAPAAAGAAAAQPPAQVGQPASAATNPSEKKGRSLVWPIALGAVGVVALGVGTAFGVTAINNADEANALCPDGACNEERGESLMDTARTQATVSNVGFAVGIASVTAAVIVYLVDSPKKSEQKARLLPTFAPGQLGLALRGQL